jgi:hypothetical protein
MADEYDRSPVLSLVSAFPTVSPNRSYGTTHCAIFFPKQGERCQKITRMLSNAAFGSDSLQAHHVRIVAKGKDASVG